jgi:hypothetical protein
MQWSRRALIFTFAAVLAWLGWVFVSRYTCSRRWRNPPDAETARRMAEFERVYGGAGVRILQFYSPTGDLMQGDHTTICYGVVNAKAVRIEPPVDGVGPSLNRCVEVSPEQATRYTLVAEGNDGSVVSESFVMRTHPDPHTLPNIAMFRIVRGLNDSGKQVFTLFFQAENAAEISIEPAVFPPLHGAPHGQFYVAPERTTTYTLTAVGKKGHSVRQQLTVEVAPKS